MPRRMSGIKGGCRLFTPQNLQDPLPRVPYTWTTLPQDVLARLKTHVEEKCSHKAITGAYHERRKRRTAPLLKVNCVASRLVVDGADTILQDQSGNQFPYKIPKPPPCAYGRGFDISQGYKAYIAHYKQCRRDNVLFQPGGDSFENNLYLLFGSKGFSANGCDCKFSNYTEFDPIHPEIIKLWNGFMVGKTPSDMRWECFYHPAFRNFNSMKTILFQLLVQAADENLGPEYVFKRFNLLLRVLKGENIRLCPGLVIHAACGMGKTTSLIMGTTILDKDCFNDAFVNPDFYVRLTQAGFSIMTNRPLFAHDHAHKIADRVLVVTMATGQSEFLRRLAVKKVLLSKNASTAHKLLAEERKKFYRHNPHCAGRPVEPAETWIDAQLKIEANPNVLVYSLYPSQYVLDGLCLLAFDILVGVNVP